MYVWIKTIHNSCVHSEYFRLISSRTQFSPMHTRIYAKLVKCLQTMPCFRVFPYLYIYMRIEQLKTEDEASVGRWIG